MTKPLTIPHHIKIEAFFWKGTPKDIAASLAHFYRQTSFTGAHLIDAWMEESALNPLLREQRPLNGFDEDKRALGLKLLREMMVVA